MTKSTKPKCSLLATKEGWRVRDAAGMMFTITEIDSCGYRWCECTLGRNKYLQKFTCAGDALIATGDKRNHAVKVFPPRKQKAVHVRFYNDGEVIGHGWIKPHAWPTKYPVGWEAI